MKVLVLGGTRFFGIHMVNALLDAGHEVTIATRGTHPDSFGNQVERLTIDRTSPESLKQQLAGKWFDVACDNIAYCSEDVRGLLEVLEAGRYIMTSSGSVYDLHKNVREEEFDPFHTPFLWAVRDLNAYSEGKRQAECAVFQAYRIPSVAVRFPYVIGEDDYTRRLAFYVEHVYAEHAQHRQKPMYIDNPGAALSFIRAKDAGHFLAWLAGQTVTGTVNGCNGGTVTIREILDEVQDITAGKAALSPDGEPAPYNGTPDYTLDTSRAEAWGYSFPSLFEYLHPLLEFYAAQAERA